MKITIQSNYRQESSPSVKKVNDSSLNELKMLFENMMKHDEELNIKWVDESEVVLNKIPSMQLHSFLLQAERLGKNIEYHKQTVIKIVD